MPTDVQILGSGSSPAPLDYTVSANAEFLLKSVNATFTDNGASGDWLPCVTLISDSGDAILRAVDQGVKVTAGDDAEVSWFRGVKHASTVPLLKSRAGEFFDTAGHAITSGVVTAKTFDQRSGQNDPFGPLAFSGLPISLTAVRDFRVHVDFGVLWTAGNYDRYIEIAQPVGFDPQDLYVVRHRDSLTPDGDWQWVSAVVVGNPAAPAAITFNVFQASGTNKNAQAFVNAYGWPEIAGQGGWPG